MINTTSQDKQPFVEFLNKFVKVVYDDFGKPSIARGILTTVQGNFIYLIGDRSRQYIPINKITSLKIEERD